jgi:predicted metal-dependent HD superfamily phosphohydrolase
MIKEQFLNLIGKYSGNEIFNLECWNEIEKKYNSKSRFYHNLEHIKNMLIEMDKVKSKIMDFDTMLFSIYYHDIVYKPTKKNNEHQSALIFKKRISKTSFSHLKTCITQIELTKEHQLSDNNDTNIFLDLDLSILGKSQDTYKKYCASIRKEYSIYPDFIYRKGRKKALNKLLELNTIFKTDYFIKNYETQAKENIRLELKQLTK